MDSHGTDDGQAVDLLRRSSYGLLAFEGLLGLAHFPWPDVRWGQGRHSYFNLANSMTLASWPASIQLLGIALLALVAAWRERRARRSGSLPIRWVWELGAAVATITSPDFRISTTVAELGKRLYVVNGRFDVAPPSVPAPDVGFEVVGVQKP